MANVQSNFHQFPQNNKLLIMSDPIPYLDLRPQHDSIKKEILAAIEQAIDSSNFVLGPEVEAFEKEFSTYSGSKYTVALDSGTAAMHLALAVLNLQPGDEVITTPFTFAATAWAISYVGAKPVFVDIEESTFNIDPYKIEDAITNRTKLILPVHLYGHPCDMDPIVDLCDHYKLYLVEDAAQAHGARYKGQAVGTFGNATGYSFYPTKNLGACGEAGALTTDDIDIANRARSLRSHGSTKRYYHDEVGYNYRMDAFQAIVLRLKLKKLHEWTLNRLQTVTYYNQLLSTPFLNNFIQLPTEAPWAESAYHLYTITTPHRDQLAQYLQKHNIGFSNHYPLPLHLQPCYKSLGGKIGDFPIAERIANQVINIPLFPGITKKQVEVVAEAIHDFFKTI